MGWRWRVVGIRFAVLTRVLTFFLFIHRLGLGLRAPNQFVNSEEVAEEQRFIGPLLPPFLDSSLWGECANINYGEIMSAP